MTRGILLFFILTVLNVTAQDTTALRYASYIQPEIIKRHLSVLASDSLEGRETATEGMVKAARYVSQQFAAMG
ncbi:MAG TPA: arginyl aminopeptidase, partial [Bacteroidia bacterium]|nr:arginyl aminopeptidase [Bacteroidia bacterium]